MRLLYVWMIYTYEHGKYDMRGNLCCHYEVLPSAQPCRGVNILITTSQSRPHTCCLGEWDSDSLSRQKLRCCTNDRETSGLPCPATPPPPIGQSPSHSQHWALTGPRLHRFTWLVLDQSRPSAGPGWEWGPMRSRDECEIHLSTSDTSPQFLA